MHALSWLSSIQVKIVAHVEIRVCALGIVVGKGPALEKLTDFRPLSISKKVKLEMHEVEID